MRRESVGLVVYGVGGGVRRLLMAGRSGDGRRGAAGSGRGKERNKAGERPEEAGQPWEGHRRPNRAWRRSVRRCVAVVAVGVSKAAHWWLNSAETEQTENPKRVSDGVARRKEGEEGGRQKGRRRWWRLGCIGRPLFAGY
uniref:Uncharacterized protein n=1 Tax=Opuntia streptacantha TaxID=393608 RepID=A0A7C8YW40_OPUST